MRIAQHDARAHADELVHEVQAALEHLLVDQHRPDGLGGDDDGRAHHVGRESRPGRIVDLGDGAAQIGHHGQRLAARHQHVFALHLEL